MDLSEYEFITQPLINEIRTNVISKTFPSLNYEHQNILLTYLVDIVEIIAIKFNFNLSKKYIYEYQFFQNNYRDLIGLLLLLMPFINTNYDKKEIKSLSDLYTARADEGHDINIVEPKYKYSNIQYGRCDRSIRNKEIKFNLKHLEHNYLLLRQTIQIISNKLYVNWINVRPINDFTDMATYNHTVHQIANKSLAYWDPFDVHDKKGYKSKGLYIGDIYNVVSNNLFWEILPIKWLIYDAKIGTTTYPYIILLDEILWIDTCANNIGWSQLSNDDRIKFGNNWANLVKSIIHSMPIEDIPARTIATIGRIIMIYFNKDYRGLAKAITDNEYIRFKTPQDLDAQDDPDDYELDADEINKSLKSLVSNPKHMYEFLKDSINSFKMTWYSSKLLTKDKNKDKDAEEDEYKIITRAVYDFDVEAEITGAVGRINISRAFAYFPDDAEGPYEVMTLTYKNFYNFAKSLTHYTEKGKFLSYPKFWRSLSKKDKDEIIRRLNWEEETVGDESTKLTKWFNISGYLKRILGLTDAEEIYNKNKAIFNGIIGVRGAAGTFVNIIFDVLATNGVLSEFIPESEITDQSRMPREYLAKTSYIKKKMKKLVLSEEQIKNKWNKCHYFLTNEPYGDLEKIRYTKKGNYHVKDYLTHLADEAPGFWYTAYGMDWISQIAFFHRYINNRIFYVTGATGVGKSTQIPKLLLYSLKMINYKYNGKIVCTQPRIPPTKKNAETVSLQMGVPIIEYNNNLDTDIRTYNYHVQYQHKKANHKADTNSLMLRFVTDGMLYQDLKRNPILKKTRKSYDESDKSLSEFMYTDKNQMDIVIVDESHEHNKNMDFILSLMKFATYYNNDLKLVIISATMDEDEPIYRRYYRSINDNLLHPYNKFLEQHSIDRINIDRRLHISPPGATTRFKIDKHYMPKYAPEQIIDKILKESNYGDILVFQSGVKEIKTLMKSLNRATPDYVIAMPYYSAMTGDKRKFIEDLNDDSRHNVQIPKTIDFDDPYDETEIKLVPKGTYKRVIIIATNIAEASITINTLRFVIDNGNQKIQEFNYLTKLAVLKKINISESSQIQRTGRVGRVASGTVYYMYDEGKMKNNKTPFDIAVSDISDNLFDLLATTTEANPLFKPHQDPNKVDLTRDILDTFKNGLNKMLMNQYFLKEEPITYRGLSTHYDYQNDNPPHAYLQDGFALNTLKDPYGSFYIVHPEELYIRRNISGTILGVIEEPIKSESFY